MGYRLGILACAIMATMLLVGCKTSGGGGDASSFSGGSGGDIGGGGGDPYPSHNPEPATMAMLGSGLAAYALLKRKNRK